MFEVAEIGRTVSKQDYESEVAKLRWELLDTQRTIVELRRLAIEARANRILHLAEVEEIAAADLIGASDRDAAGAMQR